MLKKRKQLMSGGINDDLIQDIEENTNFLIAKRKNRLKRNRTFTKNKQLYHTIGEGFLKGGIIIDGKDKSEQEISLQNVQLNKTMELQESISHNKTNESNGRIQNQPQPDAQQQINDQQQHQLSETLNKINSFDYQRPSTGGKEDSFSYKNTRAPRIKFGMKFRNQQDDILSQLEQQPIQKEHFNQIKFNGFKSRNVRTSHSIRRKFETHNPTTQMIYQPTQSSQSNTHRPQTNESIREPRKSLVNNEFMTIIQNRGVYRRDNLVRQLTNQFKHSLKENSSNQDLMTQSGTTIPQLQVIAQNIQNPQHQKKQQDFNIPQRPASQNEGMVNRLRRRSSFRRAATAGTQLIEIQKIPRVLVQTHAELKPYQTIGLQHMYQDPHPFVMTGENTKGLPMDLLSSPKQYQLSQTSYNRHQNNQSQRSKDYLSTMVSDVIRKKINHFKGQKDSIQTINQIYNSTNPQTIDQDRIKESLVQIVQTSENINGQEYEVIKSEEFKNYQGRNSTESRFKTMNAKRFSSITVNSQEYNTFHDKQCKKFVVSKKDQINTLKVQQQQQQQPNFELDYNNENLPNANYTDINQMVNKSLADFLFENNIHPQVYYQKYQRDSSKQVNRFEFFLVKGNQYLYSEDYQKALKFFEEGLKNFPGALPYLYNIALVYFIRQQYSDAIDLYTYLFQQVPNSAKIFQNLLLTLLMNKNYLQIIQYRDANNLTRPRILMSQEQMNISKIIIYAVNMLNKEDTLEQQNEIQPQTNANVRKTQINVIDHLSGLKDAQNYNKSKISNKDEFKVKDIQLINQSEVISRNYHNNTSQSNLAQNPNLIGSSYFKKRSTTNHPKQGLRLLTQKKQQDAEKSILQSTMKLPFKQKSMIQQFKKEFEKKRQKFNSILEAKRSVLKDKEIIYSNIETNILKGDKGAISRHGSSSSVLGQDHRKSQLYFTIAPQRQRASSLDLLYKELSEITKTYTTGMKDPIEEKYTEIIDDLKAFKLRMGSIKDFVDIEFKNAQEQNENPQQKSKPQQQQKPSSQQKQIQQKSPGKSKNQMQSATRLSSQRSDTNKISNTNNNNMMHSKQMERAKQFIKSSICGKTKKESQKIVSNIDNLISSHQNIEEVVKDRKQKQYEKEINTIIKDLSFDNHNKNNFKFVEEIKHIDFNELDQSYIVRLEKMKDFTQMSEDEKIMNIMGITKEDLEKRKELEQDKLLNVLCPDGVTSEDRENFDKDTDEFLSYLQNNFLIKSAIVSGTEVPHLFRDSLYYLQIKKYLEKLSQSITTKLGIFGDEFDGSEQQISEEIKWESPLINKSQRKASVYNQIIKKGQELDSESTAKSTLAYYFLQKINTMGFLNKIIKNNIAKVKQRTLSGIPQTTSTLSKSELKYVEQQLVRQNSKLLRLLDYQLLDNVLGDLKFFQLFDKDVRIKIYKLGSYQKHDTVNTAIVDSNLETTQYMYIILQGQVTLKKKDVELGIDMPLVTFKAGECFGDLSIQSHTVNPYDLLSKNTIYALADGISDEQQQSSMDQGCHVFRFERQAFINSLFNEMKESLYQKIMMLKNAEFFEDLSPYALVILASNIHIREFKLGDVLIKQGDIPSECYVLLEGQCKTIYEQEIIKSTKVSKFAKKCLQTDIPKPMHYNGLDYKKLAKIQPISGESNSNDHESQKSLKISSNITKDDETAQRKMIQQNQYKYSFQNEIIREDLANKEIEYRHHVRFQEVKPGSCFGQRALLDRQIIRRHVIDESEKYSAQLKIYPQQIQNELFRSKNDNKSAQSNYEDMSYPYLENDRISSENNFKTVSNDQPSINLRLINQIDEATQQVTDMLLENELMNHGKNPNKNSSKVQSSNKSQRSSARKLTKRQSSYLQNQAPSHLADSHQLLTPSRRPGEEQLLSRNQLLVKSRLYDRLIHELLKAQLSLVAVTSSVKVMVLRKEDKNFLNETLKNIIDRKLLEKKFKDYDRPMGNMEEVMKVVKEEKEWQGFKTKLEQDMLRETAMTKKINKLLD